MQFGQCFLINSTPYTLDRETEPKTGYYHFSVTNVQAPTARSRIDRRRCYSQPSQRVGSSRVSKKAANVPRPRDYFCGGFLSYLLGVFCFEKERSFLQALANVAPCSQLLGFYLNFK